MRSSVAGRDAGFTLIEIMVVVAVLGLALALLLGRAPHRSPSLDLRLAAATLAGDLRRARDRAVVGDRDVAVRLADVRAALAAGSRGTDAGLPDLALHTPPADPRGDGVLRFAPDGSANAGRLVLREAASSVEIDVDWPSGRISQGPVRCCDAP